MRYSYTWVYFLEMVSFVWASDCCLTLHLPFSLSIVFLVLFFFCFTSLIGQQWFSSPMEGIKALNYLYLQLFSAPSSERIVLNAIILFLRNVCSVDGITCSFLG